MRYERTSPMLECQPWRSNCALVCDASVVSCALFARSLASALGAPLELMVGQAFATRRFSRHWSITSEYAFPHPPDRTARGRDVGCNLLFGDIPVDDPSSPS